MSNKNPPFRTVKKMIHGVLIDVKVYDMGVSSVPVEELTPNERAAIIRHLQSGDTE